MAHNLNIGLQLLSGQRSSYGHPRCVTPLYRIPMGIFNCVLLSTKRVQIIHYQLKKNQLLLHDQY